MKKVIKPNLGQENNSFNKECHVEILPIIKLDTALSLWMPDILPNLNQSRYVVNTMANPSVFVNFKQQS